MRNTILVTGGAGFIGSNFILQEMRDDAAKDGAAKIEAATIVNLDKLTYAGNPGNLASIASRPAV